MISTFFSSGFNYESNQYVVVCMCVCGVQYIVVEFVQNIRLSNSQISIHLYIVENSQFNPYLSQISKWLSCLSIISSIFQINRLIWTCTRTHTTKFNKELIKLSQKKNSSEDKLTKPYDHCVNKNANHTNCQMCVCNICLTSWFSELSLCVKRCFILGEQQRNFKGLCIVMSELFKAIDRNV